MTKQQMQDNACCELLKVQLDAMESLVKSMRMITRKFNHAELNGSISEIEADVVSLYETVETVVEISQGVYKVIEEQ